MTEWIKSYESPHDISNRWGYDYEGMLYASDREAIRKAIQNRWKDLGFLVNDAYVQPIDVPTILETKNKEDDVIVVNETKKSVWFQGLRKLLPSRESVVGFLLNIGLLEKKE